MSQSPIRVLLADDSATSLEVLASILSAHPRLRIVGRARDGVEAVALAKEMKPDIITMDVRMPRLDGLGAIAAIMTEAPARILVVASVAADQQDLSFRAIAAGALEVIPKPGPKTDLRAWSASVVDAVMLMSEVPVIRRRSNQASRRLEQQDVSRTVDVFAVVASTGGPPALARLMGDLPGDLPIPVLVAQHLAPGFTPGLVRWLSESCALDVRAARDGEAARGGRVYLPPDGTHLEVDAEGILRTPREIGPLCPSGDRLLASVARAYGSRSGGAVLTGMGEDGARGLLEIRRAGGVTVGQDAATSVVFGMPKAAAEQGATELLLPIPEIARLIVEVARPSRSGIKGVSR